MENRLSVCGYALGLALLFAAALLFLVSVPATAQAAFLYSLGTGESTTQGPYLVAASGVEVEFRPNNDPEEEPIGLPTLVLFRDGVLTDDPEERTIVVGVRDASVAAPGGVVKATLIVRTQHRDPDRGGAQGRAPFFTVLTDTQTLTGTPSTDGNVWASVEFSATFGAAVEAMSGTTLIEIDTPTDYYWVDLELNGVSYLPINDYAFLMENEYGVDLGADQEGTGFTGRAYHCDMFPIGGGDPSSWLPGQDADDHVQNWLLPAMHSTFQMEVNDWRWGRLGVG
jgi:hypothetical protein